MAGSASALPNAFHTDFDTRLNLVELFFSTLSEKWITGQAHTSVNDLEESIEYYLPTHNAPRPFRRYRKAENILANIGRTAEALSRKL